MELFAGHGDELFELDACFGGCVHGMKTGAEDNGRSLFKTRFVADTPGNRRRIFREALVPPNGIGQG